MIQTEITVNRLKTILFHEAISNEMGSRDDFTRPQYHSSMVQMFLAALCYLDVIHLLLDVSGIQHLPRLYTSNFNVSILQ